MRTDSLDFAINALLSRSELISRTLAGRKDIDAECDYPATGEVDARYYKELYDRDPIGARVVDLLPEETWTAPFVVFEDDSEQVSTPFEKAWNKLGAQLNLGSWFSSDEYDSVTDYFSRLDRNAGIGHFGLLLLGLSDGRPLNQPAQARKKQKLKFLRVFDESMVYVSVYETRRNHRRFGLPRFYNITMADPSLPASGIGYPISQEPVHWSRVIHLPSDTINTSEVFGTPRMRPVLNRILDLRKIYGGSAEMFWMGAFQGLSFETHPQLGGDVRVDVDSLKDQVAQYVDGLQRYLLTSGLSVKSLSPSVSDPTSQINANLEAIAIRMGIPKRILIGSERGELSSAQDSDLWEVRKRLRRRVYITSRLIVPFIDRLIRLGVLPKPKQFSVDWRDEGALSETEKMALANSLTEVLSKYTGGQPSAIITPLDFLTRVVGWANDESEAVLDAAMNQEPPPVPEESPPAPPAPPAPPTANDNCGTGAGGFKEGNTCAKGVSWSKVGKFTASQSAKLAAVNPNGADGPVVYIPLALKKRTAEFEAAFPGKKIVPVNALKMMKESQAPKTAVQRALSTTPDFESLQFEKQLGGSTGAVLLKNPKTGDRFVKKTGNNAKHLQEEYTADKIYEALGISVPKKLYVQTDTGPVTYARFVQGKEYGKLSPQEQEKANKELQKGFAVDALLANWDVVGLSQDNILIDKSGKPMRIDNGGSLRYRAQGGLKGDAFSAKVIELDSMRQKGTAKYVFSGLTDSEVAAQVRELDKSRKTLLQAAPEDLRPILSQRLNYMVSWAHGK